VKQRPILYAAFAASLLSANAAAAEPDKVPAEIIAQTADDGAVPVLVGLKVPWQRESTLSEEAISIQRQAVHTVQDQLLSELSGTKYKLVRRYDVIPGLALEVGADALAVLANSDHVTNVLADKPEPALRSRANPAGANETMSVGTVPLELFAEVARSGTALVLVGLKAPWSPEGSLSAKLVSAQRKAVAAAQNYLLIELADTQYRVVRLHETIPAIALEVGLDALAVLSRSVAVTNVLPDRPSDTDK
jgi:hypothetical protein